MKSTMSMGLYTGWSERDREESVMSKDFRHSVIALMLLLLLWCVAATGAALWAVSLHGAITEMLTPSVDEISGLEWDDIELSGDEVLYQGSQYIGVFDVQEIFEAKDGVYQIEAALDGIYLAALLCKHCEKVEPGDQIVARVVFLKMANTEGGLSAVFIVVQILEVIRGRAA